MFNWNTILIWNLENADFDSKIEAVRLVESYGVSVDEYDSAIYAVASNGIAKVGGVRWAVKNGIIGTAVIAWNIVPYNDLFMNLPRIFSSNSGFEIQRVLQSSENRVFEYDHVAQSLKILWAPREEVKQLCVCPITQLWGLGHNLDCPEKRL